MRSYWQVLIPKPPGDSPSELVVAECHTQDEAEIIANGLFDEGRIVRLNYVEYTNDDV